MLGDFLPQYDRARACAPARAAAPGAAAVRRGAGPAGTGLSPTAAGRLPRCGLVPQVPAHRGQRQHHPLHGAALQALPDGRRTSYARAASKSKSGWTAASWSSTRAGPWPPSRPPPGPSRSGPALAGAPTVSCRPTRQPDQPVTVTAHRQLLPVPGEDPGPHPRQASAQPPLEESTTDIIIEPTTLTESLDNDSIVRRVRRARCEMVDDLTQFLVTGSEWLVEHPGWLVVSAIGFVVGICALACLVRLKWFSGG